MRTHLCFRNAALVDPDADDSNPAGEKLARFLAEALSAHGFAVKFVVQEDWGWVVAIVNPGFALWIGCGADQDYEDGHLCFIEPGKPRVWRWFRRFDAAPAIARLGDALEAIVASHPETMEVRWWSEEEVRRG